MRPAHKCCRALRPPALELPTLGDAACALFFISLLRLLRRRPRRALGPSAGATLDAPQKPVPIPRRAHCRPWLPPGCGLYAVVLLACIPHAHAAAGLAQFGLDVAGSSVALSTWTGTNPCTGASTSNWAGVTCALSVPVKLALSGFGLNGTVTCSASANTSITSIDLVRASAQRHCSTLSATDTPHPCDTNRATTSSAEASRRACQASQHLVFSTCPATGSPERCRQSWAA